MNKSNLYEVWLIRKKNADGSYSYYTHLANGFPEFITGHDSRERAKHFKTEAKAKQVLNEIDVYLLGSEADIISAKVRSL